MWRGNRGTDRGEGGVKEVWGKEEGGGEGRDGRCGIGR